MPQTTAPPDARQRIGIIADSAVKMLLAAAFVIAVAPLGRLLGVPTWLMAAAGVALLTCGGIELKHLRHRPARTYVRLMVAYDAGWVLATLAALPPVLGSSGAGGEVWIGYQTAAPLIFATLLLAASPQPSSKPATTDPTH
ncbi:hypothetical protein HUT06_36305 [Actinomadura sp. NAK00032]|uniref:hypothetical protein n=1 Tax=Actinomadura sp. NAK00032 TaxID=2742128 RepID=UPI00158FF821|nr:hypothetical protein [Actinomadura sp. NAK00032]QKW38811.1 hypothetical protein HUT06_36305 [Actinomadura sp. NAK00032]